MNWDAADFVAAVLLLFVGGLGLLLLIRGVLLWRRALGALVVLSAILIWAELAVGFLTFS